MKIAAVETQVWRSSYRGEAWPAWSPGVSSRTRQTTVFLVHTDEGLTGLGADVGNPDFVIRQPAPRLVGQDPHHGGSAIGIAAHLALSGGCPNSPYVELLQDLPIVAAADFQGLIAPPYFGPVGDGFVHLSERPGLGVELGDLWERIA